MSPQASELAPAAERAAARDRDRSSVARTRAVVYDALAQALNDPGIMAGPPRHSLLAEAVSQGVSVLDSAACGRVQDALEEHLPPAVPEMRRRYAQILAPPGRRPVATYESLALTGRLAGEAALDVARWYREHGLEATDGLPDSASAELAFMGFLADAEAEAVRQKTESTVRRLRRDQRRFLGEHVLPWLPRLGRELVASGDPHIGAIGLLLEGFLSEEQGRAARPAGGAANPRVPGLQGGGQCSLCGFCVQACPTGALWITETDSETSLLMAESRCTGCARCLGECPENVLAMTAGTDGEDTATVLCRSPRARCPHCGRPTVSQAELDAVFARLDADAVLQCRLGLCNDCKAL